MSSPQTSYPTLVGMIGVSVIHIHCCPNFTGLIIVFPRSPFVCQAQVAMNSQPTFDFATTARSGRQRPIVRRGVAVAAEHAAGEVEVHAEHAGGEVEVHAEHAGGEVDAEHDGGEVLEVHAEHAGGEVDGNAGVEKVHAGPTEDGNAGPLKYMLVMKYMLVPLKIAMLVLKNPMH